MTDAAVGEVVARLAREGIRVTVASVGEGLRVDVQGTAWSWPHTWLVVFLKFLRSGYGVAIR